VDEVLFSLFAERVNAYLDAVGQLAETGARAEACRLAAAWQALLLSHRPLSGGCRTCSHRHFPWSRRSAMCGVWRVAIRYFVHRLPLSSAPAQDGANRPNPHGPPHP
jgi:hypothetical protein